MSTWKNNYLKTDNSFLKICGTSQILIFPANYIRLKSLLIKAFATPVTVPGMYSVDAWKKWKTLGKSLASDVSDVEK